MKSLIHESFFGSPPHNLLNFLEPHSSQCYICLPQFLNYHWLHPNQPIRHTHIHLTNSSGSQTSFIRSNNLNLIISVYLVISIKTPLKSTNWSQDALLPAPGPFRTIRLGAPTQGMDSLRPNGRVKGHQA